MDLVTPPPSNPGRHTVSERRGVVFLYRDSDVVVVAKPTGIAVHRGLDRGRDFLMTQVRDALGQWVYPVHRLDKATSGAVVFATRSESARLVQQAFEAGTVGKVYRLLVRGITPESGVIDYPLRRHGKTGDRVEAVTHYRRLGTFERFSWLEARPTTGRLHQIRRHFKHLSHPLVGDVRYGKGPINREFRQRFGLHRLALHALELGFDHPVHGEPVRVRAPLPDDLANPLRAMGLADCDPVLATEHDAAAAPTQSVEKSGRDSSTS